MTDIRHPWQNGPAELIACALEHLHREGEADQRIAFLLLDVSVETLFKTFLLLSEKVTGTKHAYGERKKAAEGTFRELCDGLEATAGTRLKGIDLADVLFYHDKRNQLYHEGNGITVPRNLVRDYAKLTVGMLNCLLGVDLSDELRKPEIEALRAAERKAQQEREKREIEEQISKIQQARRALAQTAEMAIEKIYPKLLLPSFTISFEILRDEVRDHKRADLPSTNLEQARAALEDVVARQEIRDLGMYQDRIEFYLGLLEPIVRPQASVDPSPNAVWFYQYRICRAVPYELGWRFHRI